MEKKISVVQGVVFHKDSLRPLTSLALVTKVHDLTVIQCTESAANIVLSSGKTSFL